MPNDRPAAPPAPLSSPSQPGVAERCDYCSSPRVVWRKCKLVCLDCAQIVKSCADL